MWKRSATDASPAENSTSRFTASARRGTSVLSNAAIEPEIDVLVDYLLGMGAKISGRGTRTLVVEGVKELRPGNAPTIPDRIEAGTFLAGAVITHGHVKATKMCPGHLGALLDVFKEMGCKVTTGNDWADVDARGITLKPVSVTTLPYPGFPTDLQAPLMAVFTAVPGKDPVPTTIYTLPLNDALQIRRLGAD